MLLRAEPAQRDRPLLGFAAPDDKQDRHLGDGMFADLEADFLVANVDPRAEPGRPEPLQHLARIFVGIARDRGHHRLHRRQPEREPPGIMLDEHADEALEGAENGAVEHDRPAPLAALVHIGGVQPFRQHEIHLESAALPVSPDGVAQHEFELGAVEGAFAGIELDLQPCRPHGIHQRGLRLVPDLVLSRADLRTVGEFHQHVVEAEIRIDTLEKGAEALRLRRHLVFGGEDMGVVLREGAHPHDAVQRAGGLVAVAGAELRHAQRQVAVALDALLEYLHVARAVHRLQREQPVLRRLGHEHMLAELLPMARGLPERAVEELRRLHLDISVRIEAHAHIVFADAEQRPALGHPEDRAGGLFLQVEQAHLAPDAAVVAPLGLGEALQMRPELLLVAPCRAVDALQHLVAVVAAPVGARHVHQLERLAEPAGGGQVRPPAEVHECALPVDRDRFRRGDRADDLGLVVLALAFEESRRLVAVPDFAGDRLVAVHDLAHPLLKPDQVLGCERLGAREVVIEAVLDHGADGDLDIRVELLRGLGKRMGGIMADEVETVGIGARHDLDCGIVGKRF